MLIKHDIQVLILKGTSCRSADVRRNAQWYTSKWEFLKLLAMYFAARVHFGNGTCIDW